MFNVVASGELQSLVAAATSSAKEKEGQELNSGKLEGLRNANPEESELVETESRNDKRGTWDWDVKRSPYHWDVKRAPIHWDVKRAPYHWDVKRAPYHWDVKRSPYHFIDSLDSMSRREWWPWSSDAASDREQVADADSSEEVTAQQKRALYEKAISGWAEEPEAMEKDNVDSGEEVGEPNSIARTLDREYESKRGAGHEHRNALEMVARRAAPRYRSRNSWISKRSWLRDATDSGVDGDREKDSGRRANSDS